ncbi:hypothetical protein E8A66_08020 [Vibrio cholerae]|uniref:Uncharacterized protein n=3 Tax=Vibrio cholerae TaxID=666 RepID=A0ABD7SGG8_VIBCL|nr:hypothetical protein [Vibrio cholerae]ACP07663.1 conserved hypothetical protein [Vibrio cholerae M66-2]AEA80156.1 hypothetical protein VCLMA_B0526 [Vibrio cholerae LMA3984-4]ANR89429.1 hypothetical protein BBB50_17370 [Vibrio cholerae 2740-80]EAZ72616.1 hypothetical protein A5C_A0930 [Vibrio cholerae NCTC 8457]EEO00230.1 hypothetical protein VCG_001467 [Vibrio cholerae 12129(1)]EEO01910.1 hypothetical protein VCA_000864 [Vibrio cholerae VL426]EEO13130.1 hypothetical protein VCB_001840 [Vi
MIPDPPQGGFSLARQSVSLIRIKVKALTFLSMSALQKLNVIDIKRLRNR